MSDYAETVSEFNTKAGEIRAAPGYRDPILFSIGRKIRTGRGTVASIRYPFINGPGENPGAAAILSKVLRWREGWETKGVQSVSITREEIREALANFRPFLYDGQKHENIEVLQMFYQSPDDVEVTLAYEDVDLQGVGDATLKLYALSTRKFLPNKLNLNGIFAALPNVTWEGDRAYDGEDVRHKLRLTAFNSDEHYSPNSSDRFPLYLHHIDAQAMGVRIVDGATVRLGASLGVGAVIMSRAASANYNSGTEGKAMVEGALSQGIWIGNGTDIGGGASTVGNLSGGNNLRGGIGRNCLLEPNCTLGIPIGDATIIKANTPVLQGSRVTVDVKGHHLNGQCVKAVELSGASGMTFWRNDTNGRLEMVRLRRNIEAAEMLENGQTILNEALHKNN